MECGHEGIRRRGEKRRNEGSRACAQGGGEWKEGKQPGTNQDAQAGETVAQHRARERTRGRESKRRDDEQQKDRE